VTDWPVSGDPNRVIIGPTSLQALGVEMAADAAPTPASVAWGTINLIRLYPFVLAEPVLVRKLWIYKGATVTGSVDCGIYAEDGPSTCARIIAASTAGGTAIAVSAGANALQEFDIADIQLGRGRYYMAAAMSLTTTTMFANAVAAALAATWGWADGGTAPSTVLPASITPVLTASAVQPRFGLSNRTQVA
jgi:hypothetical protein